MIKVLILEDEASMRKTLTDYVGKFFAEINTPVEVTSFGDALDMLEKYDVSYDVIFTDIQMPNMDGMSAAKRIRERDKNVIIVFVTNLARYAIEGYEVNAFDFILKPVRYTSFALKLKRICNELEHRRSDATINLALKDGMTKVAVADILYVEVINHDVIVHTMQTDYKLRGTLSAFCTQLESMHFALCNSCYLVNIKYVNKIKGDFVLVGSEQLKISQPKRKAFLCEVAKYFCGSV